MSISYKALAERIAQMPPDRQADDVTVFVSEVGEAYAATDFGPALSLDHQGDIEGVLDQGHFIIKISRKIVKQIKPKRKVFTVIASVALQGTIRVFYATATDGFHAFGVVARREKKNFDLEFLVALPGKRKEGVDFDLPGEGIVCMETVLEQPDVFGPR